MISRSLFVLIVYGLLLIPCPAGAGQVSKEDVAAVRELAHSYQEAVLANNAAAVAALYTEDATELPPNLPARQGRAAIRSAYATAVDTMTAFKVTSVEIDGVDDLAYDRGTWSATFTVEENEKPVTNSGKYLCIARRQSDRSWLWAIVTWNSDLPLPGQK